MITVSRNLFSHFHYGWFYGFLHPGLVQIVIRFSSLVLLPFFVKVVYYGWHVVLCAIDFCHLRGWQVTRLIFIPRHLLLNPMCPLLSLKRIIIPEFLLRIVTLVKSLIIILRRGGDTSVQGIGILQGDSYIVNLVLNRRSVYLDCIRNCLNRHHHRLLFRWSFLTNIHSGHFDLAFSDLTIESHLTGSPCLLD